MNTLIKDIDTCTVDKGKVAIWWIGQEGFVLKTSELIIHIDPYLSDFAERITKGKHNEHVRMTPAPMQADEIKHADLIFCTHDHADHIDPDAIPVIAKASPQAMFVVPECARDTMEAFGIAPERIKTLRGDDCCDVKGVIVHAVPAKHEVFDHHPFHGYPFLSYVLTIDGMNLFHAGDTIPYKGQAERVHRRQPDLAFLPINGRDGFRAALEFEGNFTAEEAVGFALAVKAGLTIPMHYDMFTLNTADVDDFVRPATQRGLKHKVMTCGECFVFSSKNKD